MLETIEYHNEEPAPNEKKSPMHLFSSLGPRKTGGLLLTLLVLLALPVTLVVIKQQQTVKQRAAEEQANWQNMQGSTTDSPGVAVFHGQLYLFARGSGDALYSKSSTDGKTFRDWQNLGGVLTSAPAAIEFQNKLLVFTRGTENALYVKNSIDGTTYSEWQNLGGVLTSPPGVTSYNNTLYVFARGTENKLYMKKSTDGVNFDEWILIDATLASAPAVGTFNNLLYLFFNGADNTVYYQTSIDGVAFSQAQSLGGVTMSAPSVTTYQDVAGTPILSVLVRGTTNSVYTRTSSDGTSFTEWKDLGFVFQDAPAAVGFNNQLLILVRGVENSLWLRNPFYHPPTPAAATSKTKLFGPISFPGGSQYGGWVMYLPDKQKYVMYYCNNTPTDGVTRDKIWKIENYDDGKTANWINNQMVIEGDHARTAPDFLSCTGGIAQDAKGTWHMYYMASPAEYYDPTGFALYIYHATATSPEGPWTKQGPIKGIKQPFTLFVDSPSPILIDGTMYLYYAGDQGKMFRISSTDGYTFGQPTTINSPGVAGHAHVSYVNGVYYNVYISPNAPYQFAKEMYVATSTDGINFSPPILLMRTQDNINDNLVRFPESEWDAKYILTPHALITDTELRIYYAGTRGADYWAGGNTSLGLLTYPLSVLPSPPVSSVTPTAVPPSLTPVVPTVTPLVSPITRPVVTDSCPVEVSWTGAMGTGPDERKKGFWVDVSSDNFATWYNKQVLSGTTTSLIGLKRFEGVNVPQSVDFVPESGKAYQLRVTNTVDISPSISVTFPKSCLSVVPSVSNPPATGEHTIVIYAAGSSAGGVYPTMELQVKGVPVQTWENINFDPSKKPYKPYVYTATTKLLPSDIRIAFTNDAVIIGQDRNLYVDKIFIDGTAVETESLTTYSTGTWSDGVGCAAGNKQSEILHCTGYFQF